MRKREALRRMILILSKTTQIRFFTDDEHEALINGLDYVNHNSTFDEKSFICNVENLFVSLLGHCKDRPHWEKRDTNERTLYKLTPQQVQYATKLRSISDRFKRNAILELKTHDKTSQNTLNILKTLAKDESIHITHPDKGKGVVILNKHEYISKMLDILNDTTTFTAIDEDATISKEDSLVRILQRITNRGFLTEKEHSLAKPKGSHCARMHGLPKTHKQGIPLRPVISSIGSYNYRLAKVLATRLETFKTQSIYTS